MRRHKPNDIEKIRASTRMIGAMEWPPYEKARYMRCLRREALMPSGAVADLCGERRADVDLKIDALNDMDEHYRDRVDESAFRMEAYDCFVALQRLEVKEAIFVAGLGMDDFADWVRDGTIARAEDVRKLPRVLRHDAARALFLGGGRGALNEAEGLLERERRGDGNEGGARIGDATVHQLTEALSRRIAKMPYGDAMELKRKENTLDAERTDAMEDLHRQLGGFLRYLAD